MDSTPYYISFGSPQDRLEMFRQHYGPSVPGGLSRAPTVGRESRWGLAKSQIESDYKNGYITQEEYDWCHKTGLLRKEYTLTG